MTDRPMNDSPAITSKLVFGIVVLTLGVLWTLDNLGMLDASQILKWWPIAALSWGLMRLTGIGVRQQTMPGFLWTIVGAVALLRVFGLVHFTIFALWPVFLIAMGASLIFRGSHPTSWPGATQGGPRLTTFAFMAGAERKIVSQSFEAAEVSAVMGGATIDLRSATLANNRAVIDAFAMWGGIELVVPVGWRVMGEVTAILGGFQDSTAPPTDPNAPTLVVRGTAMMGGIEVRNDTAWRIDRVRAGHGGLVMGVQVRRRRDTDEPASGPPPVEPR